MTVKKESEKVGLKLNIQKTKIVASGPITSWQIDGERVETVADFMISFSVSLFGCFFYSVIDQQHYVSSWWTTTISLVTICHHTKVSPHYWLYILLWADFCNPARGMAEHGKIGWNVDAPWGLRNVSKSVLGRQSRMHPAWRGAWEDPEEEGPVLGLYCFLNWYQLWIQESSVEMNLIFLQMRKGALGEGNLVGLWHSISSTLASKRTLKTPS